MWLERLFKRYKVCLSLLIDSVIYLKRRAALIRRGRCNHEQHPTSLIYPISCGQVLGLTVLSPSFSEKINFNNHHPLAGRNKFYINNLGFEHSTPAPDAATICDEKHRAVVFFAAASLWQRAEVCFFFLSPGSR